MKRSEVVIERYCTKSVLLLSVINLKPTVSVGFTEQFVLEKSSWCGLPKYKKLFIRLPFKQRSLEWIRERILRNEDVLRNVAAITF